MRTHFKETWPSTRLNDTQITQALQGAIRLGDLHPANLDGRGGHTKATDRLVKTTYDLLGSLARALPRPAGYGAFSALVKILALAGPLRKRVLGNLALAFPEKILAERQALARAFWQGFGHALFETLDVDRFMRSMDENLTIQGLDHVAAAQQGSTGLVFVHAHQATWEMIFPTVEHVVGPICGIYAPGSIPALHRRILHRRTLFGAELYPRDFPQATAKVVKALKAGKHLIIAMDQSVHGDPVPFLGYPAKTSRGAIRIAKMAKAPLIPIDLARTGQGKFTLTFYQSLSNIGDIEDVLASYHSLLESWIRQRPADWFWLHNRWK